MIQVQLLVIAKAPVAGRVKTRLCPPCTPGQAAEIAQAALVDTVRVVDATPAVRRTLVIDGDYPTPSAVLQRGAGLGDRLANAYADTALAGVASLLVGMDTPQMTIALLSAVAEGLDCADAVLAPAVDGGWWALALRHPGPARVLRDVPMSTADTGARTAAALRASGVRVVGAPGLRDVDTAADAREVATVIPDGRFAAAVRRYLPTGDVPTRPSRIRVGAA
jgi:glycosyltransferase A (GT-A) superfamily protein (DUF2064 family)